MLFLLFVVIDMALGVKVNQNTKSDQTKTSFMKSPSTTFKGWVLRSFLINCQHGCQCWFGLFATDQQQYLLNFSATYSFHKAKESWEMDLNEKLDLAAGVKHKGNQYFKVRPPADLVAYQIISIIIRTWSLNGIIFLR